MYREDTMHTLVASSNRGRYALDTPDGADLNSGQPLSILLAGQWIDGRVEHSGPGDNEGRYSITGMNEQRIGYYFIANNGGVCGLCVGMEVARWLRED